jgi:hypothetical protein
MIFSFVDTDQRRTAELWQQFNKGSFRTAQDQGNTKQEIRLSFPPNFSENIFYKYFSDFEKNDQ